ncbi:hypothetical protein OA79_07520 [Marinomonas sp. TW1]|nr:hypothetical protein OA79_07520 [Marinomonas sp. TW1]
MDQTKKLFSLRGVFSFTFLFIVVLSLVFLIFVNSDWNIKQIHLMTSSNKAFERILPAGQNSSLQSIEDGSTIGYHVICQPLNQPEKNLCGLVFVLPKEEGRGFPLDTYESLSFKLHVESTAEDFDGRVLVFVKSYLDENKASPDFVKDYKFHAVRVDQNGLIQVPLSRFKVETWWKDMHNIPFHLSHEDLSTVHSIEFFVNDLPLQDQHIYQLKVSDIKISGVYLEKNTLYMMLFYSWLVVGLCFYFVFRYREAKKIKNQAYHDQHSTLLNLNGFEHKYKKLLGRQAIFYRVKIINWNSLVRNFGLSMSNTLLQEIVQKHSVFFRSFFYISARLSHDELVFVRRRKALSAEDEEKLIRSLLSPITVVGLGELRLDIKIGASIEKPVPDNSQLVLDRAQIASQAILNKDARIQLFSNEISQLAEQKSAIEQQIIQAIEENAFYLLYMPIFSASQHRIVGVEALLRSHFGDLKNMSPEVYISVAEERGLVREIDAMVIDMALNELAASTLGDDVILSINVSSQELMDTSFVDRFSALVERSGVRFERLCIEITETFLIDVDAVCVNTIKNLRALGCRLSLDDFGTGYTSFQQLINFPVDEIKIDRSFITDLGDEQGHDVIVDSLISIASFYDYHVVAEGVESKLLYDRLVTKGCDLMQGYYISRPISLVELAILNQQIVNAEITL